MTIRELVEEYLDIREDIRGFRERQDEVVDELNHRLNGGKWEGGGQAATAYEVKETRVRAHVRRGYSTVRVSQISKDER